ncbi:UDP-2,3-diacylglucosamine pyrophosphatase LpxI [Commensalibacter sp. Nvir]|uniref:LpxI family protein n=1 Tax=Commensalibacter sp. Nvir TaxID=3069817 RepID=UPI002D2AB0A1|nr:UDP-2,3-diacylglucosamine pyrophosphatase LpxI [Commensalibacter sp. Nvir]
MPMEGNQSKTIGILAGGGPLPGKVAEIAQSRGYSVFIIAFKDFAEFEVVSPWPHEYVRLAAAGHVLSLLRKHHCKELILIGPVKRPSWKDLRPDAEGVKILAKLGKALFSGDDGLLAALVNVLGNEGFIVRGAHDFLNNDFVGVLGSWHPDQQALQDIAQGIEVNRMLGQLDIGQACIVQQGVVIAVEAIEGTDAMLNRAKEYQQPGLGGILIKQIKPNQERRADMPTIGPVTVKQASQSGLRGIAFEARETLLICPDEMIELANALNIFLLGYDPKNFINDYLKK